MNAFKPTLGATSSLVASPASKMTMKCPNCGAARLSHDTRDMSYTYKGEHTSIPVVTGDFCPACGEVVLDREQGDRYSELVGQFQRQVNAAFVDPSQIAKVRKNLHLDQQEGPVDLQQTKDRSEI